MSSVAEPLRVALPDGSSVGALLLAPADARSAYVFAHGAGAGMHHGFMERLALALARERVATLRYQFSYTERGSKRPDPPALCKQVVRAAVAQAAQSFAGLPLWAGGKSFGGRMTSEAQAEAPLDGVRGLVFFGFPLHPAGKPATARAAHLARVRCPMLFLQGTRDELAERDLIDGVVEGLGRHAMLQFIDGADHGFHVLASSGTTDEKVLDALARRAAGWMQDQDKPG